MYGIFIVFDQLTAMLQILRFYLWFNIWDWQSRAGRIEWKGDSVTFALSLRSCGLLILFNCGFARSKSLQTFQFRIKMLTLVLTCVCH